MLRIASSLCPGHLSSTSRLRDARLAYIHPILLIRISYPLRLYLIINATTNESQFLHSPISPRSKDVRLNSIQVPSHPHPGLEICVSPPPGALIHTSFPSMWLLTSIQILMFVSPLHPCDVSPPSRPSKLHLSSVLTSPQPHQGFKICVSSPSRSYLIWIRVQRS